MRKALHGASFAEAVKTSQPKVNSARREAKAKSSKKAKASKSAKQAQTQTAASPTEGGSTGSDPPPEPANNSSTSHLQLRETLDMAVTHTGNVKATPEQMTCPPLNEESAISPTNIEREARQLTKSAISKVCPEDHNQTQNSCSVSTKSPSAMGKTLSPSGEAGNTHTSISMAVPSKSPAGDLKGSSASSHQSKPKQTPQSAQTKPLQTKVRFLEQVSRIDGEKAEHSSPLQVNSDPGPKEECAAMDTSADLIDFSDGRTIFFTCEPPKTTSPPSKYLNPEAACFDPDRIPSPPPYPYPKGIHALPGRHYLTLTGEHVPAIPLPEGQPSVSAQVDPIPESTTHEQETKQLPNNPAPQPTTAETNEVSETNQHKSTEEKAPVQPSPPASPQPPPRPEGRWHRFTTDRTCVQRVRCQHRQNGSLPKNVLQW